MSNITRDDSDFSRAPLAERANAVAEWLADHKAGDLCRIDLSGRDFADALFVATAQSVRQGQALADGLAEFCRERKYECLGMEGYNPGQWILVDLNDVIVNIFQEQSRELYRLEDLWRQTGAAEEK